MRVTLHDIAVPCARQAKCVHGCVAPSNPEVGNVRVAQVSEARAADYPLQGVKEVVFPKSMQGNIPFQGRVRQTTHRADDIVFG